MPDIFISYKRENQPFAETLRECLIAWGFSVWMDVYDIPPGAHWPDAIDAGINAAHTTIGVISPEAVKSRNVKNEWDWAIVNKKRLLLLMLEPCTVPVNYVSINYIDATTDRDSAFERLRGTLDTPAETPTTPTDSDPHLPYLQALYERINTMLAHAIIKIDDRKEPQPIDLVSERTRGAVDELFEKRAAIDPFFAAMGMDQSPEWEAGDFRAAYDHFGGRVLLLGEPGAGKTITLLHFGRDAVVQRIQDQNAPLPILALIPTWDARSQPPLAEWVGGSYGAPSDAKQVIESGRALLLLDGLDELGGEREEPDTQERYDPRERFIEALDTFVRAIHELPLRDRDNNLLNGIIVTCRVKDYNEIGAKIPLAGAVTLQNLSDAQIRNYLDELPDLWTALESDEQLREIARTPLLLSFFAFAYRDMTPEDAAKLRDLTDSPGDLRDAIFERYVHERYAHEERKLAQRGDKMPFSLKEIYRVLGRVAMRNAEWGHFVENVLSRRYFQVALNRAESSVFLKLAIRLNLIVLGENDLYRFIHLLLRDHFAFGYTLPGLRNATWYVRSSAARVLGNLSDARAVKPLIAALSDPAEKVRCDVAKALGNLGDARAVEPLIAALDDTDTNLRSYAAEALGWLGDTRAVQPLINALGDVDEGVRYSVVESLAQLGGTRAVKALIATFDNEDMGMYASTALGEWSDAQTIETLIAALSDPNAIMRRHAADALGWTKNTRAVEALILALGDPHTDVRVSAISALRDLRDARAVEPLIPSLSDPEAIVRSFAANALLWLGDTRAVEPLIAALDDTDADVRRNTVNALGQLGDLRAVEPLIAALDDTEEEVRSYAADALGQLSDARAVQPLIAALDDAAVDVCISAAEALGILGDTRAVERLITVLGNTNRIMRIFAARALGRVREPQAVGSLIAVLCDADERVHDTAAQALTQIGTAEALAAVAAWRAEQDSPPSDD